MKHRAGSSFALLFQILILCAMHGANGQTLYDVRLLQERAPGELLVTLQIRGSEAFGLGDAVVPLQYDTLAYHPVELLSAPVFGIAPYRQVELFRVNDSIFVGMAYDYRNNPGKGRSVLGEWTDAVQLRFPMKTKRAPFCTLLPEASAILRDDGYELTRMEP